MRVTRALGRLLRGLLLMVLGLTGAALVVSAVAGGWSVLPASFGIVFFAGGTVWLFLALMLGGSVETYIAPAFGS